MQPRQTNKNKGIVLIDISKDGYCIPRKNSAMRVQKIKKAACILQLSSLTSAYKV